MDPGVIFEEKQSRNTRENAEYSVAWMRERGFKSAVVVTSWWHSRRAMACFRKFGPELEFGNVLRSHLHIRQLERWRSAVNGSAVMEES